MVYGGEFWGRFVSLGPLPICFRVRRSIIVLYVFIWLINNWFWCISQFCIIRSLLLACSSFLKLFLNIDHRSLKLMLQIIFIIKISQRLIHTRMLSMISFSYQCVFRFLHRYFFYSINSLYLLIYFEIGSFFVFGRAVVGLDVSGWGRRPRISVVGEGHYFYAVERPELLNHFLKAFLVERTSRGTLFWRSTCFFT